MSEDEIRTLDREVKRLRRVAGEWAGQLHDLVEDRLPNAYAELPALAQSTFAACQAWAEASAKLSSIQTPPKG